MPSLAGVLDKRGLILALFFGLLMSIFGGISYLALMLVFFFLAIIATHYEYEIKKELGIYEHERGWENVFANGILPTILAILPSVGVLPFICSVAAITADKFGSEIGVLDSKKPISIFGFNSVSPGTSGAISLMGSFSSFAGACAIGLCSIFLFNISPISALKVGFAGFCGSFADTLFGYFEERGIGTKGTTNFFCSLCGALIGFII